MVKRSFIAAVLVPAWLLAMPATVAWAISVAPPRTEVALPPGGEGSAVLIITNIHEEPYDVEITQKPWFIYPDNKTIKVEDWLILPSTKKFRLKAGKTREVKLKIKCPKNAVGELMGMVSFAYQTTTPGMITPMISTAIYLRVKGTERLDGEIAMLGAGTRNGRFQVGAQIKATGNVRLLPIGTILLKNDKGETLGTYTLNESNPIFPMSAKECAAAGPQEVPAAGHYVLSAEVTSETFEFSAERGLTIKENGEVVMDALKEKVKP